ncbi:alpha/beta fold hydrolase [Bradyrhizobium sp. S3.14.4]
MRSSAPTMISPHLFSIGPADTEIAMLQWGESGRPPALLVHGTGFVADVWDEVARELASSYTVYALDRRGHGASHKPDAYHFLDYAEDVCRVIDALDLRDVYGIGHSAGANRSSARDETSARTLHTPVRDGADRDGPARGAARGIERRVPRSRPGHAAPAGRVRQCRHRVRALPRCAGVCRLDRDLAPGLCPTRLRTAGEWPGSALLHARDRIRNPASDLRGDGAGLCRRCPRQPVCRARRDRMPRPRRDRREVGADLQGDGATRRVADSACQHDGLLRVPGTAWRRKCRNAW